MISVTHLPLGRPARSTRRPPGLRDVDRVAARLFGDGRPGSLCHGPLQWRRDHPVIGRHQVPVRLAAPSRLTHLAIERLDSPRDLRVGHERCLPRRDIGGERSREFLAIEEQEAVTLSRPRLPGTGGIAPYDQGGLSLTSVGFEGTKWRSARQYLRVNTSFVDQATEVVDITCQHRVAVSGKQRDMGVDDICCLGCPAEVAG